jgi:hypothetical protein
MHWIDRHGEVRLQKLTGPALKAFAEEIYYKAQAFGIYDVRTSIAFYNISRVFYKEVRSQP